MATDKLQINKEISGRVRCLESPSDDISTWFPITEWKSNTVLYEWGAIAGRLFNGAGMNYSIGGMYLEYENVSSPSTDATIPTFGRDRSISYFNNLSTPNDYLRVPLTSTQLLSSGDDYPNGNQCVFFARSQGTSGVHAVPFSNAANSKIIGASLVAFVDDTDATQDLVLSSMYFSLAEQQLKTTTSQIGVEWELTLT